MRQRLVGRAQGGDDVAFTALVDLDGPGDCRSSTLSALTRATCRPAP